jgi:serine/threonine protein kinase
MSIYTVHKDWEIQCTDLIEGIELGRGSFGVVVKATLHGMDVAVKKIAASASSSEKDMARRMLNGEVKALSRCQHVNIVRLIGACSNPPMLVLAFASNGSLRDLLRHNYNDVSSSRKMELLRGICNGMLMLHSKNILHLDLKPENVLISSDGTPWVADFGLAIAMTTTLTGGAGSTTGGRGTMQYKAPELFKTKRMGGSRYEKPADVYSFCMVVWEMFSGSVPFAGMPDNEITSMHIMVLLGQEDPERPSLDAIPMELKSFVEACWNQDPTNRPTFEAAAIMLDAVPILATGALNAPGSWYVFISHTQRNPEGKLLALDSHTTLKDRDKSSWLDVKMEKKSVAAMEEGVKNASCVVAIITDSCVTSEDDPKKGGPEQNAYFNRWMCIQELRWAIQYNVPIQPVVRVEDKKKIGDFIKTAPDDLKFLIDIDWIDLNRNDKRYFDLGIDMVIEGVDELVKRMIEPAMMQMYAESRRIRQELENASVTSSGETKTNAIDSYDLFLSHKQNDINPDFKVRIKDLARTLNEHFTGRGFKCFLDKNFNGNSWNDLPNLVACSKTFLVVLSEKFVESPWCVLELLSAIMHKRPIAFFRISDTFKLAAFKQQLVDISFPNVNVLDDFSVEINYNEDHFDSAMNKIAERVENNKKEYPMSVDVVTRGQVAEKYEELRKLRNRNFPNIRSWPSWGRDETNSGASNSNTTSLDSTLTTSTSSIERVALEKEIEDRLKEEMKHKNIEQMNVMRAKMEMEYENKAKAEKEAREKAEKEKVSKKRPVSTC